MIRGMAVLIRNTTWKCGRIERLVVNYLRRQIQRCGRAQTPIKDMLEHLKLSGKQKSDFLEAIKRLEKRRIIKIEGFWSSAPLLHAILNQRKKEVKK